MPNTGLGVGLTLPEKGRHVGDAHIPDLFLLCLPSEVMLKEEPFARDVSWVLPILIIVQVLGNFFSNFILNRFSALLSKSDSSYHCSSPSAAWRSRPWPREHV